MTSPSVHAGPLIHRWAMTGAIVAGIAGGVVGLIVGLVVYAPTAWFAVFELGIPAALVGGLVGCVGGVVAHVLRGRAT